MMEHMSCITIDNSITNIILNKDERQEFIVVCKEDEKRELTIDLADEGAGAKVYGVFFGRGHDQVDLSVTVQHLAPHTTSEIMIIGALDDGSKGNILGTIHIAPGAFGSKAREEIRTLMLSKEANVRAIPELKIENNDVQCSHAVTTTHIDEEKKFYLESRGMSEKETKQAVIDGHFASILQKIPKQCHSQYL